MQLVQGDGEVGLVQGDGDVQQVQGDFQEDLGVDLGQAGADDSQHEGDLFEEDPRLNMDKYNMVSFFFLYLLNDLTI